MKTIHSALKLEMLLKYYYSPRPEFNNSTVVNEGRLYLYTQGLIDRSDEMASITEKGRFFIEHLLKKVPLPERTYFIPEMTNDTVASG